MLWSVQKYRLPVGMADVEDCIETVWILKHFFRTVAWAASTWVLGFCVFLGYSQTHISSDKTDAIIVLTGGINRIETGLRLYQQGLAPKLFISGVLPNRKMSHLLQLYGKVLDEALESVDQEKITLGHNSYNTATNAQEIQEWVYRYKFQSIRLVTANYHMPRAVLEIQTLLPDLKLIRHPVVGYRIIYDRSIQWRVLVGWLREYCKLSIVYPLVSLNIRPSWMMARNPFRRVRG